MQKLSTPVSDAGVGHSHDASGGKLDSSENQCMSALIYYNPVAHSSSSGHSSPSSSTGSAALDDTLFGVRVNGLKFYFYSIPVSDAVLTAMSNSRTSTAPTIVYRLMNKNAVCLDWAVKEQRAIIIEVLDAVRSYLSEEGSKSQRRNSEQRGLADEAFCG